tara:strand:- start:1035 stop:4082 length:3048 start_codon:yes stop_codon:yes gene_type:complete
MDNAFSNLIPEYRIGRDSFNWWIGQVEKQSNTLPDIKGSNRYKVRIVGEHLKDCEVVPAEELPWASVIMPVNLPFSIGNLTGTHSQLKQGSWVIGFYLDPEKQKPIIMGSIGMTPGATKVVNEFQPGECNSFTTFIDPDIDVNKDGIPAPANNATQSSSQTDEKTPVREPKNVKDGIQTGSLILDESLAASFTADDIGILEDAGYNQVFGNGDGTFATFATTGGAEGLQTSTELTIGGVNAWDAPIPPAQIAPLAEGSPASEDWCQEKASKCGPEDLKTTTTRIMGEFLAEVQRNNGNIGTYLVGEATGGIYDAVYTARKYTNKFISVIRHFIAKIKGFIIEKLTEAVELLIKAVLRPDGTGNVLTPATEWFNKLIKDLGCKMADIGERLIQWITDMLMGIINDVYQSVACQIDAMVNGILSKLTSLLEDIIDSILGPLQDLLGPIANALNLVGGAIAKILEFLGISCTGPEAKCSAEDSECTDGEEKKKENDFLDDLLESIDNMFPDTSADYNQYTCEEAYNGKQLQPTRIGFRGGVFDGTYGDTPNNNPNSGSYKKKIVYDIKDIEVLEGDNAVFTVTRSGYLTEASSVTFKTIGASATPNKDFLMVDDIVGFAPNESSKKVEIKTINDSVAENDELFFARIKLNSPDRNSGIVSKFENNVAKCVIKQKIRDDVDNYDPYDPYEYTSDGIIEEIDEGVDDSITTDDGTDDTTSTAPSYNVVANRTSVSAGEFIIYTVTTENVRGGTVLNYRLSPNFIPSNIIGGVVSANFVINDNSAKITVGIVDEYESETDEVLTFSISSTNASADVLVLSNQDISDVDEGVGDDSGNVFTDPSEPVVDTGDVITDDSGKIIEIPVTVPGGPYTEPPFVTVGGNGIGASATALLNNDGFVSEIRVLSGGYGYKKNLASNNGKRCIIDTFTLIRPGAGYQSKPTIYINDDPNIAEAIINDDGFVIGARVLNREVTFDAIPKMIIVGGGGYGAKLMPSLACLSEDRLVEVGATKIGTGRYVDCP